MMCAGGWVPPVRACFAVLATMAGQGAVQHAPPHLACMPCASQIHVLYDQEPRQCMAQ